MRKYLLTLFVATLCASGQELSHAAAFTNPLLKSGPDPWVIYKDGFYYEMNTSGQNLAIRKTKDITELRTAERKIVWTPPPNKPYSSQLWAPELHFLRGKWYIYFAADAGQNPTHRLWVVENASPDPLVGEWTFKGQVTDPSDKWAIDATVFEQAGKMYMVWSGWPGEKNGTQNLYMAQLENPWTVTGKRVKLSSPEYPWEKIGSYKPPFVAVNEGPEILKHGDKIYLTYSASGCWTDYYAMGMLTAEAGSDLMNPQSGPNLGNRCSLLCRKRMPMGPAITASFNRPMVRKTGLSITLIRNPAKGAKMIAPRAFSSSLGMLMEVRGLEHRWR